MLEVLQYYTSGFWVWLGITMGFCWGVRALGELAIALIRERRRNKDAAKKGK